MWQTIKLWSLFFWCLQFSNIILDRTWFKSQFLAKLTKILKYLLIKKSSIWLMSGTQIIILSWYLRSPNSAIRTVPRNPRDRPLSQQQAETPWWSAMERTVGGFWKLPKTIRIGENSGGERELLGDKNPTVFWRDYTLGICIFQLKGSRGKPPKRNGQTKTNYSSTKAIHWKQEASL